MNSRPSVSAIRFRKLSRIWRSTKIRKTPVQRQKEEGALNKLEQLEKAAPLEPPQSPSPPIIGGAVLCIPGLGLLDEAVAIVLAQLLRRGGISAQAKETGTLSMSKLFALETENVALICLCYLEHATPAQMHYASRRIRRKTPGAFILAGVFNERGQPPGTDAPQLPQDVEFLEGPLSAVVKRISSFPTRNSHEARPDADTGKDRIVKSTVINVRTARPRSDSCR
jgi:hypothetical protein